VTTPDTDGSDGNQATYARSSALSIQGDATALSAIPHSAGGEPAERMPDAISEPPGEKRSQREAGHEGREHRARRVYRHAEDEPQQPKPQNLIDEGGAS
jgi:hypothetical protein